MYGRLKLKGEGEEKEKSGFGKVWRRERKGDLTKLFEKVRLLR